MPVDDVLTPMGASYIATNAYFTLKDCMRYDPSNPGSKPQAAPATRSNGQNRVFGPGNAGRHDPRNINPTLHNTGLASANLSRVFSGNTGLSTCSGFCYLLQYKQDTRRHVVIAPRGTRPELGAPNLGPISLIAPFPYSYVNPAPTDENNRTLPSPTGELFSTANHDMNRHMRAMGMESMVWDYARSLAARCGKDNSVLATWLLHKDNDPGWAQFASAKTLGLLFKLFGDVLRTTSTAVMLGLTVLDVIAEMILSGGVGNVADAGIAGADLLHDLSHGLPRGGSVWQRNLQRMVGEGRRLVHKVTHRPPRAPERAGNLMIACSWLPHLVSVGSDVR